jgi:RsiW-degrading membrane proteinase PrsW (M82 family)
VVWLLVVTTFTRSVWFDEALRFWFVGYFTVMLVVLALGRPFVDWLGDDDAWRVGLVAPVIEELAKLAPLVLFIWLSRRRKRSPSLSDLILLGAAVGAGFAFAEDLARARTASDGFAGSVLGALFPTALRDYGLAVGHVGWTIVAAAGLGIVVLHRRRLPAVVLGLVLIALAVADHARANLFSIGTEGVLSDVLLDGQLVGWVLPGVVVAVLVHDAVVLRWTARRDDWYPPLPWTRALPLHGIAAWRHAGAYRRFRAAVFVDLFRVRSTGRSAGDRSDQRATLDALRRSAER